VKNVVCHIDKGYKTCHGLSGGTYQIKEEAKRMARDF